MLGKLRYLRVGLAGVLLFAGAKMLLSGVIRVPIAVSLAIIAALLAGSIVASLVWPTPGRKPDAITT